MFLFEPERTQFDLNWRMFGVHVRVHPMFWLMSALLGYSSAQDGLQFLLVWVLCVLVSILVHELGHVLAGRLFGTDGYIVLYSFGGLAIGSSDLPRRWQRVIVYFAGPLAGFLLFGVVLAMLILLRGADLHPLATAAIYDLIGINLFWNVLNLAPIWPLDGGKISREFWEWVLPSPGLLVSLLISGTAAALLSVHSLAARFGHAFLPYVPPLGIFGAIFFGMMALTSFQLYQMERNRQRGEADEATAWDDSDDDQGGRGYWRR